MGGPTVHGERLLVMVGALLVCRVVYNLAIPLVQAPPHRPMTCIDIHLFLSFSFIFLFDPCAPTPFTQRLASLLCSRAQARLLQADALASQAQAQSEASQGWFGGPKAAAKAEAMMEQANEAAAAAEVEVSLWVRLLRVEGCH